MRKSPHEDHSGNHKHHDHHHHGSDCHDLTNDHYHGDSFWSKHKELIFSITTGVLWMLGLIGDYLGYHNFAKIVWLIAYLPGGAITLPDTLRSIASKKFNIEGLMIFASIGAGLLGQLSEGILLLFLFGIGHSLEHFALNKARRSIKLLTDILPKKALLKLNDKESQEILVDELKLNDVVIVKPYQSIPCDGIIISGVSSINQATITGESIPVDKFVGDQVFAGSLNEDGVLEIKLTKSIKDNTLSKMLRLIVEAGKQKSPTQLFAEKFERIFVPIILFSVVFIAIVPALFGWLSWSDSLIKSIIVLVSASPCALVLSTPVAVLIAISKAARFGVLIKGGMHLENLGKIDAIALDKTGTITQSNPIVKKILCFDNFIETDLLSIAYSLEKYSTHPLAIAVVKYCEDNNIAILSTNSIKNVTGKGISGSINNVTASIGNLRMFDDVPLYVKNTVIDIESQGYTVMLLQYNNKFIGIIGIADPIRDHIANTIMELRKVGIKNIVMLTGDNHAVANSIAKKLDLDDVQSNLLPEDKVKAINQLNKTYKTAIVGDGINDAPAMANAMVGIAMGGTKTDVAIETADVVLINDSLDKLPIIISISKKANIIIKQNLFLSLAVIGLLILGGVFGVTNAIVAITIHEGSSLVVIFNALRLLRTKK